MGDALEKEIFVYGLRRGGIHAITNFVLWHFIEDLPNNYVKSTVKRRHPFRDGNVHINDAAKYARPYKLPKYGSKQVISYEDRKKSAYGDIGQVIRDTKRPCKTKLAIVVLRDPYNWIASHKKRWNKGERKVPINLWIRYAKTYFIDGVNDDRILPLNFNRWFEDKNYRRSISDFIQEKHTDQGTKIVSSVGSSFNSRKYNKSAGKMQILDRWKSLGKHKKLFDSYPQLRVLSKKIFNFSPF
jgi:hypothetical protein